MVDLAAVHPARQQQAKHPGLVESIGNFARHLGLALGAIGVLANDWRELLHLVEIRLSAFTQLIHHTPRAIQFQDVHAADVNAAIATHPSAK